MLTKKRFRDLVVSIQLQPIQEDINTNRRIASLASLSISQSDEAVDLKREISRGLENRLIIIPNKIIAGGKKTELQKNPIGEKRACTLSV